MSEDKRPTEQAEQKDMTPQLDEELGPKPSEATRKLWWQESMSEQAKAWATDDDPDGFEEALQSFLSVFERVQAEAGASPYWTAEETVRGADTGRYRVFVPENEQGRLEAGSFQLQLVSDEWRPSRFEVEIWHGDLKEAEQVIRDEWRAQKTEGS
jgi:hypothetical protein